MHGESVLGQSCTLQINLSAPEHNVSLCNSTFYALCGYDNFTKIS